MCDGIKHCPFWDDEQTCDLQCPLNCFCQGFAFVCSRPFNLTSQPQNIKQHINFTMDFNSSENYTRISKQDSAQLLHESFTHQVNFTSYGNVKYLDASNTLLQLYNLPSSHSLIFLRFRHCKIFNISIQSFPNLKTLDLSYNDIVKLEFDMLAHLGNLRYLVLANNPVNQLLLDNNSSTNLLKNLNDLDLSFTPMKILHVSTLSSLTFLNMSFSALNLFEDVFPMSSKLENIDLDGLHLTEFEEGLFKSIATLTKVSASDYRFCCSRMLPGGFNPSNCHAPSDPVASCDKLLSSTFYMVILGCYAAFNFVGNILLMTKVTIYRSMHNNKFVTSIVINLCISNLIMCVYTLIILLQHAFLKPFVIFDLSWRSSMLCKTAGTLYNVCTISCTLLLLVLYCYQSAKHPKLKTKRAFILFISTWTVSIIIAFLPTIFFPFKKSNNVLCVDWTTIKTYNENEINSFKDPVAVCMTILHVSVYVIIFCLRFISNYQKVDKLSTEQEGSDSSSIENIDTNFSSDSGNSFIPPQAFASSAYHSPIHKVDYRFSVILWYNLFCWLGTVVISTSFNNMYTLGRELNSIVMVIVLPSMSTLFPYVYVLSEISFTRQRKRHEALLLRLRLRLKTIK